MQQEEIVSCQAEKDAQMKKEALKYQEAQTTEKVWLVAKTKVRKKKEHYCKKEAEHVY